jgi:hypothetical protein
MKGRIASIGTVLISWLATGTHVWASIGPVPEIDATGAFTGLAVLVGVLAVVAERKRQK